MTAKLGKIVEQEMTLFIEVFLSLFSENLEQATKTLAIYRNQRGFFYALPGESDPEDDVLVFPWPTVPDDDFDSNGGDLRSVQGSSSVFVKNKTLSSSQAVQGNSSDALGQEGTREHAEVTLVDSQKKKRKRKERLSKKGSKKVQNNVIVIMRLLKL